MRKLGIMALVVALVVSISGVVGANEGDTGPVVNDTTGQSYSTIQEAIGNAAPGDTLSVYPGMYEGDIIIDQEGLTLRSVGMHEATIVAGLVTINADNVVLDGFKLRGYGPGTSGGDPIIEVLGSGVTVQNLDLRTEAANFNHAGPFEIEIQPSADNAKILDNVISRDFVSGHPVIGSWGAAGVVIEGNTVTGPIGIDAPEGSTVTVKNNTVEYGMDEGIWFNQVTGASLEIEGNAVEGYGGKAALKIVSRPASVNGKTMSGEILAVILEKNPGTPTVYLPWMMVYEGGSIQAAIDASKPGDTVVVYPGTYVENVTIDKEGLTLKSVVEHGAEIQGTVVITRDGVTLDCFKITNFAQIPTPDWSGVYIPSGTSIIVSNNLVDGTGLDPAEKLTVGVHTLYGGSAEVTVQGNTVRNVRLGIYNQGATMLAKGNTIENVAHCAIGVDTASGTMITDNTIRNSADVGVEIFRENVTITDNLFENSLIHLQDFSGALDLATILQTNTFDRAAVVNQKGALLGTIWSSIQDAIDAAAAEDIVEVAPGTYEEDLVLTKTLSLYGAQSGVDPRGGRLGDESRILGSIRSTSEASRVVIDGFEIVGTARSPMDGVCVRTESPSVTLKDSVVVGVKATGGYSYSGIVDINGVANAMVQRNSFSGAYDAPRRPNVIRLGVGQAGTVVVADNAMQNVGGGGGIGIMCDTEAAAIVVTGNLIEDTGDGIWAWTPVGTRFASLEITSNVIRNQADAGLRIVPPVVGSVSVNSNSFIDNTVQVVLGDPLPSVSFDHNQWSDYAPVWTDVKAIHGGALEIVSGDGQKEERLTTLPDPLVVQLTGSYEGREPHEVAPNVFDEHPMTLPGTLDDAPIEFTLDAPFRSVRHELIPSTPVTTNDQGLASVKLHLGSVPGTYEVTASVVGYPEITPVTFTAQVPGREGAGGGAAAPPEEEEELIEEEPVVAGFVAQEVDTSEGGTVSTEDGKMNVNMPAGAVAEEESVTLSVGDVTELPGDPQPGMVMIAGKVYQIEVETSEGEKVREFSEPLELTFSYDEEDLDGTDPSTLAICYWDEELGAWIALPSTVDPETGTVSATVDHLTVFALMSSDVARFSDTVGHWAEADVLKLASLGIAGGYPDGTYRPNEEVTREQFAKLVALAAGLEPVSEPVVALAAGLEPVSEPVLEFGDAGEIAGWAEPYVGAAVDAGIIAGYPDGTFGPKDPVTRQQVAAMLVRALDLEVEEGAVTGFADDDAIASWAKASVAAAVDAGLIAGYTDGTFKPQATATRAQVAKMLSVLVHMVR